MSLKADSKIRYPREEALAVARSLCVMLDPWWVQVCIAGSLRCGKADVGDIELLYIPKIESRPDPDALLGDILVNLVDQKLAALEDEEVLERRKNVNGAQTFGARNKFMRHRPSGIPVDIFATQKEAWWNYLVCRTGPAESNRRIATAALERGWKWNPYSVGFTRLSDGEVCAMTSEQEVFQFVGLPYLKPEER